MIKRCNLQMGIAEERETQELRDDIVKKALSKYSKLEIELTKRKKDLLVSVIIPVYNAEKNLSACLLSIINQTYENLEIICVNDGSTDRSSDILAFYEKKDKRIKVINQRNRGPSAARNTALDHASGDYISFVDSDDYLQLNAYEILTECAAQKENWDLIFFGGNIIGEENAYISDKLTTVFKKYTDCKTDDVVFNEKAARPFLWMHFIKREVIEVPKPLRFEEELKLGEDQVFQFCYVPRAKNVMVIDQKLYNYRFSNNTSLMHIFNHRRIKKTEVHFQIVERVVQRWKEYGYYENHIDCLWTWIVEFIYWTIIDLPSDFRKVYSARFISIVNNEDVAYLILESETLHFNQMKEWSIDSYSVEQEIKDLEEQNDNEKYEIEETLKSRAFKIGRMITPRKKRIDL